MNSESSDRSKNQPAAAAGGGTDTGDITGRIFNIQRYSIHDGPGIRTTVFVKGCPLRCAWCQNPESHVEKPEIHFNGGLCTLCGRCIAVCPSGASTAAASSSTIDRAKCTACGRCVEVCPNDARRIVGRQISVTEAFEEIRKDEAFYRKSGGGATLSGGEPLAQPEFTAGLLELCRRNGIHSALDTCGYAGWDTFQRVLPHCDLVLYDIKNMDTVRHKKYTGVSNRLILDNARKVARICPMWVRVTVVPGCVNGTAEEAEATAAFLANELGTRIKVCLLPYHRLGEPKYENLGRGESPVAGVQPPDDESMAGLQDIYLAHGLETQIGG